MNKERIIKKLNKKEIEIGKKVMEEDTEYPIFEICNSGRLWKDWLRRKGEKMMKNE